MPSLKTAKTQLTSDLFLLPERQGVQGAGGQARGAGIGVSREGEAIQGREGVQGRHCGGEEVEVRERNSRSILRDNDTLVQYMSVVLASHS